MSASRMVTHLCRPLRVSQSPGARFGNSRQLHDTRLLDLRNRMAAESLVGPAMEDEW